MNYPSERITQAMELAVKETNRNLYEWMHEGKKESRLLMPTMEEIRSLLKTWLSRSFKKYNMLGLNNDLRKLEISISVSGNNITKVFFSAPNYYTSYSQIVEQFNYCSSSMQYTAYNITSTIDFSKILAIKF